MFEATHYSQLGYSLRLARTPFSYMNSDGYSQYWRHIVTVAHMLFSHWKAHGYGVLPSNYDFAGELIKNLEFDMIKRPAKLLGTVDESDFVARRDAVRELEVSPRGTQLHLISETRRGQRLFGVLCHFGCGRTNELGAVQQFNSPPPVEVGIQHMLQIEARLAREQAENEMEYLANYEAIRLHHLERGMELRNVQTFNFIEGSAVIEKIFPDGTLKLGKKFAGRWHQKDVAACLVQERNLPRVVVAVKAPAKAFTANPQQALC